MVERSQERPLLQPALARLKDLRASPHIFTAAVAAQVAQWVNDPSMVAAAVQDKIMLRAALQILVAQAALGQQQERLDLEHNPVEVVEGQLPELLGLAALVA
jgi:hypothetical protein